MRLAKKAPCTATDGPQAEARRRLRRREIDYQAAMEPGFQSTVDWMIEASWKRGEVTRSLRRSIAAANMTRKEKAKVEIELAIPSDERAGKAL
jgi:hypothetical protein